MYALSGEDRDQLMRISLAIVCGGSAILPFTVPPTSPAARAHVVPPTVAIAVPRVPGALRFPEIRIDRDPFVADDAAVSAQATPDRVTRYGAADEIGIVLPPNAGARSAPPETTVALGLPVVRGIVLGDVPQALIDAGNGVKVYSVGDRIGNNAIASIDSSGVVLSNGVRLAIVHEAK